MNAKQAKYPQLRFKGFTDPWEQRKLGDLGDILRKSIDPQLTPSREFVEYSMPSYDRGKRPNRVLGESMQSTRLKISGTVLLINKLNVRQRRIWFVKKAPENAVASGEFVPFQSFEIDLGFLHQLFLSDKTTSELQSISSGTSNSQKRVTPSDLLHYPICIPTTKGEQVVVGRFLSSIDNLITLHQRKLAKLKELKQGYLQKLFPKNGAKVPELRFAGFADAWEQRKLGEVATFLNGRAYKQDELLDSGKYKVLRVGNFYTNDSWYYSNMELGDKYYVDKGDLVYTWSATFGPHIWSGKKVIYHYHIWKVELSKFLDRNFTLQLLEADKARLLSSTNGSTMIHVTKGDMESKIVSIPNIDEQKQIGSFFKQLDNTITLHQGKLEKLQELKKGYLQKMFC
ncbi:hypothetical protein A7K95_06930 [Pediococcus parvulus]|uniref:Type I restriction modification DNA specificity domain-containing protein n=1 Tax=Pediococcus parvulus TaxID=54062 RepID=A0ABX2UFM5_9LACO|nr:restriction endonuclease subunit S [Pediococcus parvulus]OAD64011.1 hypothetical protein A7K95_06930 [Pediococcus parvulus]